MKRFLLLALFTTLTIFFGTPMVLGIMDAWCYIVLGATVTGVKWAPDTVTIAWLMLIPGMGCLFAGSIIPDACEPPPRPAGTNPPPTYERPPAPPNPPPPRDLQGRRG